MNTFKNILNVAGVAVSLFVAVVGAIEKLGFTSANEGNSDVG